MRIKVATHSGFCFGVKRAINIAEKNLADPRYKNKIYSLGAIIHNPQVVDDLSKKGLKVIKDISSAKKGAVIISSHGAPIETIEKIKAMGLKLIDASCPFVKYAHDIVKRLKREGYRVLIIGDKKHPEVKALLSLAGKGGNKAKIGVVSQTTQNKGNYIKEVLDILKEDFKEVRVFNTICNDTSRRQTLARRLLKDRDVVIVVGGRNSANTKRLWQICKESGASSFHIETPGELKKSYFRGKSRAGIVSGASTPDSMVKKVAQKIKNLTKEG
ncbi:MAG: 4-hydroxy-3-methylbut-2-enyl diphosphate reductase [Candidatus Omnitrophica bacterium]|nr:4-hydroxy-3-methylbut-2-enyl diphosphate reductase [Candidatus Omnitrophota bacterium]MBU4590748.1 4-hydroxy-3-methylbut-2-enyl diphosphate reductase [Candidatus Omnitrophota bacterium]